MLCVTAVGIAALTKLTRTDHFIEHIKAQWFTFSDGYLRIQSLSKEKDSQ